MLTQFDVTERRTGRVLYRYKGPASMLEEIRKRHPEHDVVTTELPEEYREIIERRKYEERFSTLELADAIIEWADTGSKTKIQKLKAKIIALRGELTNQAQNNEAQGVNLLTSIKNFFT